MRHQKANKKLSRPTDQRLALIKGLAISLIEHKKIITTQTRAKQVSRFVDGLITKSKVDTVHSKRYVKSKIDNKAFLNNIFEISKNYKDRNGGYTRIINVGSRRGDGATMSILQLVD